MSNPEQPAGRQRLVLGLLDFLLATAQFERDVEVFDTPYWQGATIGGSRFDVGATLSPTGELQKSYALADSVLHDLGGIQLPGEEPSPLLVGWRGINRGDSSSHLWIALVPELAGRPALISYSESLVVDLRHQVLSTK